MADFVAVIRRAVDGLAENTPEMRVKVYDRARGAVQRQLESMKPRPPEEMLRRQLDKLEVAIVEVEAEHAEALPGAEEPVAEAPVVHEPAAHEPVVHEDVAPEPVHEQHQAEEVHAEADVEEPVAAPAAVHAHEEGEVAQPAHEEPVHEEPAHEEPASHGEQDHAHEHQPVEEWGEPHREEEPHVPAAEHAHAGVEHHAEIDEEPTLEPVYQDEPQHHVEEAPAVAVEPVHAAPAQGARSTPVDDVISQVEQIWAEVDAPTRHSEPEPVMPAAAFAETPFGHPVEAPETAKAPAINKGFAWDADVFEELQPSPAAGTPVQQPARQMPENAFDDVDLFADVHPPSKTAPDADAANDGWRELKELAGFDKRAEDERGGGSSVPPDLDQAMAAKLQGRSFRMEPKRRRFNITGIIVTLVGLAVVGGGGYAAWLNRDALNNMVTKLVSSATKNGATPPATDTAGKDAAKNGNASAPAQQQAAAPQQKNAATQQPSGAGNTNVAAVTSDPNTVNTKFTQRLLTNGAEKDEGPAPNGQPGVVEGKSVAEQNVASAAPSATATPPANNAAAAQTQAPAAAAPSPSASTDQQAPAASQQQQAPANQPPPVTQQTAAATDGQKVFLYEERLGQTSPSAFQGTVTWSVQEGKGADGRPEPSVQGLISVPDRGLTATITVSRNSDSSLPASHLIELAFQVPPTFEGGAIDNVQRVALKATEQDRGDALIAVPAKVTDDVYMVALNDFPDARKTNLDLLKSRNWIDIPVVYRNGRRALLTMEKGPTGTDAFNKAISEWQALGGVASSGQ
ncbi:MULTISPECIES: hypothetical protein [unclassified Rhizobium]|uniref:hypothetical protein n=1 Tax=unclassified Rhizobium TaxID=2613769 RepID=UPI000EA899A1|nr:MULTISPECIES: hypothetical protein [unclassified Rhizobium]AYG67090.1 hypothetical protein CCGE531_14540 [Rhizobium sp. CCGE531]AYG73467.1 hypothetical protein CCGE532_13955 [Rhizobium sp. CCGE532]